MWNYFHGKEIYYKEYKEVLSSNKRKGNKYKKTVHLFNERRRIESIKKANIKAEKRKVW